MTALKFDVFTFYHFGAVWLTPLKYDFKVSLSPSSNRALKYCILFCMMSSSWCINVVKLLLFTFSKFGAIYCYLLCFHNSIFLQQQSFNVFYYFLYVVVFMMLLLHQIWMFKKIGKIPFYSTVWPRKRENYS